jgi:FAD/FMN-containing dehydrogenase
VAIGMVIPPTEPDTGVTTTMTIDLNAEPTTSVPAAHALRGLLGGRVHLPGDPGYDAARLPWNVAVDQRPAAVAFPRSAAEVATVVRVAASAGFRVAPQSTGHNAGPLAAQGLDDVVLVRMSEMATAIADPARGIVRVEGGAIWEPAVDAAAAHGKAVLHGSSPDVGIAGYSLGGGIGWYARKHGLASNSITAVELVIADGTLVRADATTNPEIFWAVRGGGGNFGVVTALEFKMYDIETAYAGFLLWDLADIEPVLREWAAWAPSAPDEVTTSFRAMRMPPMPELPDFLRGRELVVIDGAVLGSDERGEELLAGLRALRPQMDTFARVPAKSLVRLHMDPEGGAPFASDSAMLASFPDAAIDAFLAEVGPGRQSSLLMAELRQLGGALGRPHEGGGVLDRLDAQFVAFAGGMAITPEMGAAAHADAARLMEALAPFDNGRQYLNFAENPVDARSAYGSDVWTQLTGIRSAVDPHGTFAANHPVPRLFENGQPS